MKNLPAYLLLGCILLFASCSKDAIMVADHSVTIGEQLWDNKNLDVSTYRNGDPIPQVADPIEWASLTTGAWCYYNYDTANNATYGKLYNWYAVNDSLHGGLAPEGWHIPSSTDYAYLGDYLGGDSVAGGKMKSTDINLWTNVNVGATNSSRFNALPAGIRSSYQGMFFGMNYNTQWWTSTRNKDSGYATSAWSTEVNRENPNLYKRSSLKTSGFAVRCLKGNGSSYLKIGDHYLGGIIAYKFKAGDLGYDPNMSHGIIVAEQLIKNGAGSIAIDFLPAGKLLPKNFNLNHKIGFGSANTKAIVKEIGDGDYAAKLCDDLMLNGYTDWCLPSMGELNNLLFATNDVGIFFSPTIYSTYSPFWASSSYNITSEWFGFRLLYDIYRGGTTVLNFETANDRKSYVRPIRYF